MQPQFSKPSPRHDHVYAIVRYDSAAGENVPIEIRVTIKKIVADPQVAKDEVERLNALNHDKDCYYFSQITRIEKGCVEVVALVATKDENTVQTPGR